MPVSILLTSTVVSVRDSTYRASIIGHHCCDNNRPKLTDLSKYNTNISTHWKEIAFNLGISKDIVSTIDANYHSVEDKCLDMFNTWLDTTVQACWCHLIQALCSCDVMLQRIADEVKTI